MTQPVPGALASLLLLADGRLPVGTTTHSSGIETAVERGDVTDLAQLAGFLLGRLGTGARLAAAAAAQACRALAAADPAAALADLAREVDARTPSPAVRAASHAQGRGVLRFAARAWPHPLYADEAAPLRATPTHHAVALGVAAAAAGCGPEQAAVLAATATLAGPAAAAVRLLGLDPVLVAAVQARLAPTAERIATAAAVLPRLPADSGPAADLLAEEHAGTPVTLFAS
ncbi:MAG TPA: urease accessory UreF family protein [Frankiaceae bacterium]|jgi:urease accessory protein